MEAASAVSQRSHGIVLFPSDVEEAISESIGAGKKGQLRQRSSILLQELRSRSRSVSRGGLNVLPSLNGDVEEVELPGPAGKVLPKRCIEMPCGSQSRSRQTHLGNCRRGGRVLMSGNRRFRAC